MTISLSLNLQIESSAFLLLVRCLVCLACFTTLWASEPELLEKRILVDGESHLYRVFLPSDWKKDQKWPVILFLHGAGERGSDGVEHTSVGLGPAITRDSDAFPAIVVMPQCRRGAWWNDSTMEKVVMGSLEQTVEEYGGDRKRIYLTGLSMGGYGTFYFGAKYPEKFAALVPICGGVVPPRELRRSDPDQLRSRYLDVARAIKEIPIWMFHGADDYRVPVSESRQMERALNEVGAEVRYTEYEGVGHNSWDRAYGEAELFPWMLKQRR